MVVTIADFAEVDGAIRYNIKVRLPLRSIEVGRRYSEFVALVQSLCQELGISVSDFPYVLPPKSGVFLNKVKVASDRKDKLARFLNQLVKDPELQNRAPLHRFLQLPPRFQFSRDNAQQSLNQDSKFLIDEPAENIDASDWLYFFRVVRSNVQSMEQETSLEAKVANREKLQKYIRPNLEKLTLALQHQVQNSEISKGESRKRNAQLQTLLSSLETVSAPPPLVGPLLTRKRDQFPAKETRETTDKSNRELLTMQQQIQLEQDKDIEELRKAIARQKQIGEIINQEIEEQSEMLDAFGEEIDRSARQVRQARDSTTKITK